MVRTAEQNPRSVVGAVLVNWDDRTSIFQVAPKWNLWWGGMRHWVKQTIDTLPNRPWKVELIVGNCVLFPADAIREVGYMDEKRLPQYGDAEYTPRMRKAGWTLLIDPGARVFCKPNDIPERVARMPVRKLVSKIFFDPYHPHSLKRRLNTSVGSAPNKLQGYAAVLVFFARVLLGRNVEGNWALSQTEPPLSETYRNQTVRPNNERTELRRTSALN
jgi:GT2 family glycosyltransferase